MLHPTPVPTSPIAVSEMARAWLLPSSYSDDTASCVPLVPFALHHSAVVVVHIARPTERLDRGTVDAGARPEIAEPLIVGEVPRE